MSIEIETWVLEEVSMTFAIQGRMINCKYYGSGHINDTSELVRDRPYILQRMNGEVFGDPVSLMRDIEGVTIFLKQEVIKNGGNPDRETLNLVKTEEGETFYVDSQGSHWRIYLFIEGVTYYNPAEKPGDFYQSSEAFGHFQRLLSRYPARELSETISSSHNTPRRFQHFQKIVDQSICNRVDQVREEIRFVADRGGDMGPAMDMLASRVLPLRITHNDTKLNNIMISSNTGQVIYVIDLDTVVPELSIFDSDGPIWFGANTAEEDETDLSKVSLSLFLFETYTKGFLKGCIGSLTEEEVKMLPQGVRPMTLECGIRFLADYLEGDIYFKTVREKHNSGRCRTQLKLVEDMEQRWEETQTIVEMAFAVSL